jgi:hypothetical protein
VAGRQFRVAVGVTGEVGVGASPGGDEREAGAIVGIAGQATVFGGSADGDHKEVQVWDVSKVAEGSAPTKLARSLSLAC